MGKPAPISLGLTSNPGRAPAAGSARLVNCYAEIAGKEGKSNEQVWASDGLAAWTTSASTDGTRAAISVNGALYTVRGRSIYSYDAAGNETRIGGIASDAPVTMARNRRPSPQIGIVSQDGQYVVIDGGVASDYSSILRGGANSICSVAGYFVFTHSDGSVSHTQEDNATSVDLLAYGLAESSADPAIRGLPKQGEVVAFGTKSIDFFANVGGDPFAFQRNQSISLGCAASGSCAEVDQTLMFIASDLTVRILNGYQAVRVSNHAIERTIAAEPAISQIIATTWTRDGHTFYCISGTSFSLVYDLATQCWHDRQTYNDSRWLASCITEHDGELIVGAYNSGKLYKMTRTAYTEGTLPLVCKIITPPSHAFPYRVKANAIYIDMIPGVGTAGELTVGPLEWAGDPLLWGTDPLYWGDGSFTAASIHNADPQLMLRCSFDGGATWSAQRTASIGQMGELQRQITFRRIGTTKRHGIVFELSASAAVMRGFLGMAIDADKLAA